jgi:hypothetical protein
MDATPETENEVRTALHACDNRLDRIVNKLLEEISQLCTPTLSLWCKVDSIEQIGVAETL